MKEEKMVFPHRDNGPTRVIAREVTLGAYGPRGQEKASRKDIRVYTGNRKALR
jgi:hypothetical protein